MGGRNLISYFEVHCTSAVSACRSMSMSKTLNIRDYDVPGLEPETSTPAAMPIGQRSSNH